MSEDHGAELARGESSRKADYRKASRRRDSLIGKEHRKESRITG